jgi:hypothetical protein
MGCAAGGAAQTGADEEDPQKGKAEDRGGGRGTDRGLDEDRASKRGSRARAPARWNNACGPTDTRSRVVSDFEATAPQASAEAASPPEAVTIMKLLVLTTLLAVLCARDVDAQQSRFGAELQKEKEALAESCGAFAVKAVGGCVYTLATQSPFHLALGSIAPQNGFAFGGAFDEHFTTEAWRISWNADAVAAPSGAWRAGTYVTLLHSPATSGVTIRQPGAPGTSTPIRPRELPIIDLFTQTISLKTINYFGPGQQSVEGGRTVFGERQTIAGAAVVYPIDFGILEALRPALVGGINGRFIDIRTGTSNDVPSIEQVYNDAIAPGLNEQRGFLELRGGIRFSPSFASGRVNLNYAVAIQRFHTSSDVRSSFNRWTLDLRHDIPLYRNASSTGPRPFNGPDSCKAEPDASSECPPVQWSRNRSGSIGFRVLMIGSWTGDQNRVPFYLQPTLGGSDINGERLLASYADYRFRDPNLFAVQESVEHSIWGPFGVFAMGEHGKVASDVGGLNFSGLASSATVGVTLRAGGFPMMNFSFSWGSEGHHIIGTIDSTLLGGSPRPSLH